MYTDVYINMFLCVLKITYVYVCECTVGVSCINL